MEFDRDRVGRLVSELLKALRNLRDLQGLSREEFLSDPHKVSSAKYNFIVAIEAALDLCNHLIAKNRFRVPEDYADTFRVMGEEGVFPGDFVNDLMGMARFRNRLVHIYWEVDDGELCRILQEMLGILIDFFGAGQVFEGRGGGVAPPL